MGLYHKSETKKLSKPNIKMPPNPEDEVTDAAAQEEKTEETTAAEGEAVAAEPEATEEAVEEKKEKKVQKIWCFSFNSYPIEEQNEIPSFKKPLIPQISLSLFTWNIFSPSLLDKYIQNKCFISLENN